MVAAGLLLATALLVGVGIEQLRLGRHVAGEGALHAALPKTASIGPLCAGALQQSARARATMGEAMMQGGVATLCAVGLLATSLAVGWRLGRGPQARS